MKPDRVVIGVDSDEAQAVMGELYAPFTRQGGERILFMRGAQPADDCDKKNARSHLTR